MSGPAVVSFAWQEGHLLHGITVPPLRLPNAPAPALLPVSLKCSVKGSDEGYSIVAQQTGRRAGIAYTRAVLSLAVRIEPLLAAAEAEEEAATAAAVAANAATSPSNAAAAAAGGDADASSAAAAIEGLVSAIQPGRSDIFSAVVVVSSLPDTRRGTAGLPWAVSVLSLPPSGWDVDGLIAELLERRPYDCRLPTFDLPVWAMDFHRFAGCYPGAVLGIVGHVLKRDGQRRPTSVGLRRLLHPPMPPVPWPLSRGAAGLPPSLARHGGPVPLRMHFCSGPFPRRYRDSFLKSAVSCAVARGADLLVIAGPFTPEDSADDTAFATVSYTDSYLWIEGELGVQLRGTRTRVVLVPSLDDVLVPPVLPQPPLDIFPQGEGESVFVASNPCEISIAGVRVGVCAADVLSTLKEGYAERGYASDSQQGRLAETVLLSGLFSPVLSFPSPQHEATLLDRMRLCGGCCGPVGTTEEEEHNTTPVEPPTLPHVLFLPSTKPSCAHICTSRPFAAEPARPNATDPGVLFVNSGAEETGKANMLSFVLNVAEVTTMNTQTMLLTGPGSLGSDISVLWIKIGFPNQ